MNKVLTPLKAIRAKCIDCSGGYAPEVRICPVERCALHPYRFGKTGNKRPHLVGKAVNRKVKSTPEITVEGSDSAGEVG